VLVVTTGGTVEDIILFTASIDLLISATLLMRQRQKTGIILSKIALERGLQFGAPLVGAGLAMFTLGTADRLFLAHHVSTFELGLYAIAAKLALATALIMEPFGLWWGARRFAIFAGKDGAANTANIAGIGFAVLIIGAAGVALAGPLFIEWFLSPAYQASVIYLQLLVGIAVLNQACTLVSLGIYNRPTGIGVFGANLIAASIALVGYSVLIPIYGVMGAIGATYIAYACRFALFYAVGRSFAPVRYPLFSASILAIVAVGLVQNAPAASQTLAYLSYGVLCFLALATSAWVLRLLPKALSQNSPLVEEGAQ
jgi:O-antigen/teichoic acid export membrane protein